MSSPSSSLVVPMTSLLVTEAPAAMSMPTSTSTSTTLLSTSLLSSLIATLSTLTGASVCYGLAILFAIYSIALGIYRVWFHPLRRFPGPRIAGVTYWYEFWFDVFRKGGGQYIFEVRRLHELYGPIVRITPNEIHVDDPDWFDVLFAGHGQVRDKYGPAARMAGTSLGVFGTADHEKHRIRRNAIGTFFSKRSVRSMEPMIKEKVELLCSMLEKQAADQGTVEIRAPFLAFGTDIICDYALGVSPHGPLLPSIKRQQQWRDTISSVAELTGLVKQYTWLVPYAMLLPSSVIKPISESAARLKSFHEAMGQLAQEQLDNWILGERKSIDEGESRTVFRTILRSDMAPSEKSKSRLADEGFELIAAGGETVSRVLTGALFFLLSDPDLLSHVVSELDTTFPGGIEHATMLDLETLPWLTATIKEALRIGATIASRLPLVSPQKDLVYGDWVIPAGTPVSMSTSDILRSEKCFDDPEVFRPERWLPLDRQNGKSEKYFVPFARGTRNCLGINLAYAELYLVLATLLYRYDMNLCEANREQHVDTARDCFVGRPLLDNRVKVKLQRRAG